MSILGAMLFGELPMGAGESPFAMQQVGPGPDPDPAIIVEPTTLGLTGLATVHFFALHMKPRELMPKPVKLRGRPERGRPERGSKEAKAKRDRQGRFKKAA